jgi:hypothetical protein
MTTSISSNSLPCQPMPLVRPDIEVTDNPQPASTTDSKSFEDQANLLDACSVDIKALQQAGGLDEVIAQVESGDVAEMRRRYGPDERGRGSRPEWKSLKVTVNKRERIYDQLATEFAGNKEAFFVFFTIGEDLGPGASRQGKGKRKRAEVERQLRASNKVAEAIPRRDRDLRVERASSTYLDGSGQFSQSRWDEKWGSHNQWQIWRALGKEHY